MDVCTMCLKKLVITRMDQTKGFSGYKTYKVSHCMEVRGAVCFLSNGHTLTLSFIDVKSMTKH